MRTIEPTAHPGAQLQFGKLIMISFVFVLVILALAYRFRHRIEHFRPDIRFRTLETITVAPSVLEIPLGARRRLVVSGHYRDGSIEEAPPKVRWTSSVPRVAEVAPDGTVTARDVGTATIGTTLEGATSTTKVSVVPAGPIALAIFPTNETLPVGGSIQYKVMATNSDGSSRDVTDSVIWNVSNPLIVGLNSTGHARARTAGNSVLHVVLNTPQGKIETQSILDITETKDEFRGVFTYRYDNTGMGQDRFETKLTARNVNPTTFGKLFASPVDGYVYAQPLYVPGVQIRGKGTHNVLYAATENDSVFALDADDGSELFGRSLGSAVPANELPCRDMGPEIGITGTPAIDPETQTMYVSARTYENGANFFRLHALDITSGLERPGSPVLISAAVPGDGRGSAHGQITFDASTQLQRPGLRIVSGQVVVAFGSLCDRGSFHGWVFLFDKSSLKQTGVFLTTPNGEHGGIWQAGAAPVVDAENGIYVISGDGEFDVNEQGKDYGDSVIGLRTNDGGLLLPFDYFTPYDQGGMEAENLDLGSSGPMLLPDQLGSHSHLLFAVAKSGSAYLLDRDDMGHFQSTSNSQAVQYVPNLFANKVHSSSAYWSNATAQWIYIGSTEGKLQAFPLNRGRLSTAPSSETLMTFSYPGVTPVISSHGNADGIVWALEHFSGVLRAFSATDLSKELYNSSQAPNGRDRAEQGVQFYVPLVANGKVYFGSRGHVYGYGLLR